ncbi:MAG: ABC transporter ATP-binding protein [Azospirillaceae bacterium]
MDEAAGIVLDGISKTYPGARQPALDGVSLGIEPGAFFSILGPSGCGKTTLLRILAGFEYPTAGRVIIGGRDVTGLRPRDRGIAMVFQDYALYPHMTVERNITFNLRNKGVAKAEIAERLATTAGILRIERLLDKKPRHLSGGERQRVALGRALIRKPRVFLMDEPLSNLDLKLREAMRLELGRLHQELGITIVYVTHDQSEAMTLSSALAIMNGGRVQQTGEPAGVYADPANIFVARFIGSPSMNVFNMGRHGASLRAVGEPAAVLPLPPGAAIGEGQEVLVGIRAHHLSLAAPGEAGIPVEVTFTEHLGRSNILVCRPVGDAGYLVDQDAIQVETDAETRFSAGDRLVLTARPEALRLFAADGRAIGAEAGMMATAAAGGA